MSSITDIPIGGLKQDLLKVEKYATALSNFMLQSDTPITVGLQGEWGTGKTSLMSILNEQLSAKELATSWVNTWEYSLFRGASETTPAVLQGMLEKLEESCKQEGNWDVDDATRERVKKVGKFLAGVANQVVAKQTGVNVASAAASASEGPASEESISEIKADIAAIIKRLIDNPDNPYKKVVFFVDDLDRIPPTDAVEVLEALKNIFDIPHCVFVLAIDYEVVVKGLESKFGAKTEENEREFRSFFDKIIQVPFSMPVGTYSIENFLLDKFKLLGYSLDHEGAEKYAKVVRLTVGTNPRSLKRFLNSYSLINQVKKIEEDEGDSQESSLMLFALLGVQISYPRIFRLLTKQPDYTTWEASFANKEEIDLNAVEEKLAAYGENELLDELWEKILWSVCQRDSYLRSRAFDVLTLFNFLRSLYGDTLADMVESALEFAAITNVDDDAAGKQASMQVGRKTVYAGLGPKLEQMKGDGLHPEGIDAFSALMTYPYERTETDSKYRLSFAKTGTGFYNDDRGAKADRMLLYSTNPGKRKPGLKVILKDNSGVKEVIQQELLERLGVRDISETPAVSEIVKESGEVELVLEAALHDAFGKEPYLEFLAGLSQRICKAQDQT